MNVLCLEYVLLDIQDWLINYHVTLETDYLWLLRQKRHNLLLLYEMCHFSAYNVFYALLLPDLKSGQLPE